MAETIRKVVIELSLKLVDDKALKGGVAQMKLATGETVKQAAAGQRVTQQATHKTAMQSKLNTLMREESAIQRARESRLRAEVAHEQKKLRLLQQQNAERTKSARQFGGGVSEFARPVAAGAAGGGEFMGGLLAGKGAQGITRIARGGLVGIMASFVPDLIATISHAFASSGRDYRSMFGITERDAPEVSKGLGGAYDEGATAWFTSIARDFKEAFTGTSERTREVKLDRDIRIAEVVRVRELAATEKHSENLSTISGLYRTQADAVQKIIDVEFAAVKVKRELLQAEKDKIKSGAGSFALMTAKERAAFGRQAKEFGTVGPAGMSVKNLREFMGGPLAEFTHVRKGVEKAGDTPEYRKALADAGITAAHLAEGAAVASGEEAAAARAIARGKKELGIDLTTTFLGKIDVKFEKVGEAFLKQFKDVMDKAERDSFTKVNDALAKLRAEILAYRPRK